MILSTDASISPRESVNLRNGLISSSSNSSNSSKINFTYNEIRNFTQHQTSEEANLVRSSLDFSAGQILYDPKDRKIGSNTVSSGVVSIKPHGSSYFSRISMNNFTSRVQKDYIAAEDHVMTFLGNNLYDGLTTSRNVSGYAKYIYNLIENSNHYQQEVRQNPNHEENKWIYLKPFSEEGDDQEKSQTKNYQSRYMVISGKKPKENNKTRVYAIESAFERNKENFVVKSFIENGRFGHQNNCAVITNFLLVLKSAFGNEEQVDNALFSLIKKAHKVEEVEVVEDVADGIKVKESIPRLDVRSVRAFFATFLSIKSLYEQKGIDISQDQELYTQIVTDVVSNFRKPEKNIKDDVNNRLFWNDYQKKQLTEILGAVRNVQNYSTNSNVFLR